jgi:formate-dependent nitrite reductase membrane component NrfD
MKIDWKRKLTSRKFIVAVIGFITPLLIAFGLSESEVTQIVAIIVAGFNLIAYIIGEGIVDAANTDVVVLGDDDGNI